jgi:hypothetical protein
MTTTTYYVQAQPEGLFAACRYFADPACTQPVDPKSLIVPPTAGSCEIAEAQDSELALLGASYKTLGHAAVMTDHNFSAAASGVVSVAMPTTKTVTKGVVLIFSTRDTVSTLYPSSDPEVSNGEG